MFMSLEDNEIKLVIKRLENEIIRIDNELLESCDTTEKRNALVYIRYMLSKNVHDCEVELSNRKNRESQESRMTI